MDNRELLRYCTTGNLFMIRNLVEKGTVDLNFRDKWDGTPLTYACLCGRYEVVLYLLENGATCDSNTFDAAKCVYDALINNIGYLLKDFKTVADVTVRRDKYSEFLRRAFENSEYCDIQFVIGKEIIFAHRAMLSARSAWLRYLFSTSWKDSIIDLNHLNVSSEIFKSLIQYLYLGEVRVNKNEVEALVSIANHFNMYNLVADIERILQLKKNVSVLYVQRNLLTDLPGQHYLKLFSSCLPKELRKDNIEEPPFIDLHIKIDDYVFSCHKVFVCGRCSYLKALVTDHFSETSQCSDNEIQVITLHDIKPEIFCKILKYIYTDTTDLTPENVLDVLSYADIFMLPGLKKLCSSVVQENLTTDNVIPAIKLSRLYDLPCLETQCTEFITAHFEEVIDQPDFQNLVLDDANEIKDRKDRNTVSVIDDIRYHIHHLFLVRQSFKKHLLLYKLKKP